MKKCKVCGVEFTDKKHPDKFLCSRKCSGIYRRTIKVKECPTCGKEFRKNTQYCSKECARSSFGWSRGKIFTRYTKNCKVCGKEFETVPSSSKQHTCSRECQFKRMKKWPKKQICKFCGKTYDANRKGRKFCSRGCAIRWRHAQTPNKITPADVIPRDKMKKCQRCGFDEHPQILVRHHKDRDRDNNTRENLEVLCPNCHFTDHFLNRDGLYSN